MVYAETQFDVRFVADRASALVALPVFSRLEAEGRMSQISAIRCSTTLAASLDWSFDAYVIAICALSAQLIATASNIP